MKFVEWVWHAEGWNKELLQKEEWTKAIINWLVMAPPWTDSLEPEEWSQLKMKSIPHLDEFWDGKKLKFKEWHLCMIDKLEGNADHFEDK